MPSASTCCDGMVSITKFCTDQLIATRLTSEDFDELCAMHRDPEVMATLGGLRTAEQTQRYLDHNLAHWDHHGYGLWIFRDKTENRFVGRGGLRGVTVEGDEEVEVAYAVMANVWGKGYATQMAAASVRVAFDQLELKDLVAFTLPTNIASRRVMEKIGFQYERNIVHSGHSLVLYRMRRENWGTG
jgi:[ribosomal protein S5]-alanine N-acetyltransferase